MLKNLIDYFDKLNHTIKKEDVVTVTDETLDSLNNTVLPTLEAVIKDATKETLDNNPALKRLTMLLGVKGTGKDTLVKLKKILEEINKSSKKIESLVDNELNDVVTDKTATVKDAAIIKLINDINIITMYTNDFLYVILLKGDTENTDLTKATLNTIQDNIPTYANILKQFSRDFSKQLDNISKLSDDLINVEPKKIPFLEKLLSKKGSTIDTVNTDSFNGNPIYHIRIWLTDKDIAKYELLKDKKKLIELKLLELKLKQKQEDNPKLAKRIEYYENKIAKIEYQIARYEEE